MRQFINIINEAITEDSLIDKSAAPAEYEDQDAEHYEARRKTGFFGEQASGCILMAKSTGRIMLVLRSAKVDQPHTWGNVGGAHSSSERPVDAARREAHEETGYTGDIKMVPLYVFKKDTFRYSNFLGIVEDEFEPHLGWEADRAVWVDVGRWPNPLHFGVKALVNDQASMRIIKHYRDMFKHGDHALEGVEEGLNLPAGVDIAKAVGDAHDAAKELAADAEAEQGDAVETGAPVAPKSGDANKTQGQAQSAPAGKKSLAAIKPQ